MFGLGKLLYVIVLFINSIAILSEDRFLNRIGWGAGSDRQAFGGPAEPNVKTRLINLINATRTLLRFPLILVNTLIILYELVLG